VTSIDVKTKQNILKDFFKQTDLDTALSLIYSERGTGFKILKFMNYMQGIVQINEKIKKYTHRVGIRILVNGETKEKNTRKRLLVNMLNMAISLLTGDLFHSFILVINLYLLVFICLFKNENINEISPSNIDSFRGIIDKHLICFHKYVLNYFF